MSFSNGYLPKTTAESMLKFDRWYKTNSFPWYKVRYLRKMRQAFEWESSSTGVLFLCTYTLDKRFSRIAGRYDWITRNLLVSSLCVRINMMMKWFSEKMQIFNICIRGLMPNLIKKFWTVSKVGPKLGLS